MITAQVLSKTDAARHWTAIGAYLMKAAEHDIEGRLTLGGLYGDVMRGSTLAILLRNEAGEITGACAVTTTDIVSGRALFVRALGGEFGSDDTWLSAVVACLDQLAIDNACSDGVMFSGRPGWVKKLREHGYSVALVTMVKQIGGKHGKQGQK